MGSGQHGLRGAGPRPTQPAPSPYPLRLRDRGRRVSLDSVQTVGGVGPLRANILGPNGGEAAYPPGARGDIRLSRMAIRGGRSPEEFTPRLREASWARWIPLTLTTVDEWRGPTVLSRSMPNDWYLALCHRSSRLGAASERTREFGTRRPLGAGREGNAIAVGERALWQIGLGMALGRPAKPRLFWTGSSFSD